MRNDYLHTHYLKPTMIINIKLAKVPLIVENNERNKLAEFVHSNQNFQNVKGFFEEHKTDKNICDDCK